MVSFDAQSSGSSTTSPIAVSHTVGSQPFPGLFIGVAVAVGDALPAIKKVAHLITRKKGGEGAVREVCDLILAARARGPRRP